MSARYTGGLVYNPPGGWSGYFDGSGDYLSVASNAAFGYGTGDFTIEFWVYPTSSAGTQVYLDQRAGSVTSAVPTIYTVSGTIYYYVSGSNRITGGTVAANQWSHISICRSGSSTKLFINGTQSGSTFTDTTTYITAPVRIGEGNDGAGAYPYSGYLSNFRIVKGTALYTATFTLPTGALQPISGTSLLTCAYSTFRDGGTNNFTITVTGNTAVNTANPFPTSQSPNPALGGAGNGIYTMSQYAALLGAGTWPAYDPYYENVTLNLHGNAGAVLPFNTDASTNNFQVTQVGNTSPSNYTPFITNGYWSNLFGSNSGLTAPNNSAFKPATNAFTVECWIFSTATGQQVIYGDSDSATNNGVLDLYLTASGFLASDYWTSSAGVTTRTSTLAPIINQWNHVLVSRTGTTMYIGLNGVLQSFTAPSSYQSPATIYPTVGRLGAYAAGVGFTGYISNFRYINGTNLYSGSTYTVPTAPLTAVANTVLLTCQSNRFVDNSTNAFALTVNGSPSVNPLQPFTAPTGTSAYGSGYFDGSGDYLTTASSSAFDISTGDWTVQGWYYPTAYSASNNVLVYVGASSGDKIVIATIGTAGNLYYLLNGSVVISSSTAAPLNAWSFFALVRSGSTTTLYLNGVSLGTYGSAPTSSSKSVSIGADAGGAGYQGYMSNVRILKGTADTAIPTSPLTAITNTSLLTVQTNAPSQNNTFLDSSTNNFVIARNGNTTQGTFTPYGSNWSNYFTGSSYIYAAANANLAPGTGDFTVECWAMWMSLPSSGNISPICQNDAVGGSTSNKFWCGLYNNGGTQQLAIGQHSASNRASVNWTPTLGQWYHIALERQSGTDLIFIDGVQQTVTNSTAHNGINWGQNGMAVGGMSTPFYLTGYISNFRYVVGSAVYTASFTPSTIPLTAITNTQLLTCQSNRFVDNSSNALAITVSGSPTVQRFSPFAPTTAYSTSVVGGSCYFDGSGDSMTVGTAANCASGGAFAMGANFTVEFWFYPLSTSEQTLIENFTGTGGPGWTIYRKAGGQIEIYNGTSAFAGSVVLTTGQWYHIAFVRTSSTSAKTYINGVADMSTTSFGSGEYFQSTYPLYVGQRNPGDGRNFYTTGYFSDVRVTKSAVYSGNFTPPTAPQSPVANTSAMLNYTNAAIFDNSMMTDWETLGSAQLNTAYKKYGSGSISMLATGDYCRSTQPSTVGDINGGNFTIEFWVYFTSLAADRALISKYGNSAENAGGLGYVLQWVQSSSVLRLVLGVGGGSDALYTWAWSPVVSTWYHVAVTRSGTSGRAFINGVQIGTTSTLSTSDVASPNATQIGKTHTVAQYLLGYMDDVRVTKGVARYTANFTPPTSQVQDQ